MRNHIVIKIVVILLIILTLGSVIAKPSHALTVQEIFQQVKDFEDEGKQKGENKFSSSELESIFIPIIRILVAIANVVLLIVTIVMGIKYMTTQSPEAQAKLKQQLIGIAVATILVFGAQGIWALIYNMMEKLF